MHASYVNNRFVQQTIYRRDRYGVAKPLNDLLIAVVVMGTQASSLSAMSCVYMCVVVAVCACWMRYAGSVGEVRWRFF